MKVTRSLAILFVVSSLGCASLMPQPKTTTTVTKTTVQKEPQPSSADANKDQQQPGPAAAPDAKAEAQPTTKALPEGGEHRAALSSDQEKPGAPPASVDAKKVEEVPASKAEDTSRKTEETGSDAQSMGYGTQMPTPPCQAAPVTPEAMALANEKAADDLRKHVETRWDKVKGDAKYPEAGKAVMFRRDSGSIFVRIDDWPGPCHSTLQNGVPLQAFMDLAPSYLADDIKCEKELVPRR